MAKTLVVVLEDGNREIRTQEVEHTIEDDGSIVAYGKEGQPKARFKLTDVRSWYLE